MALFGVSSQELVNFTKNFSVMLRAGITVNEALDELGEQTQSRAFRKTLLLLRTQIESGMPLSEAFAGHRRDFGDIFVSIVRAGERSGTLEQNLSFLSNWLEHNNDIKREVRGAMIYPMIIVVVMLILSGILALVVLPRLIPIFSQLAVELPWPTRTLLAITDFLKAYWHVSAIGIVGAFFGLTMLSRIVAVRRVLHRIFLSIPAIGNIMRLYQVTLIGQLFSTLFRSGMSIYEVLEIAREGATNMVYQDALREIGTKVERGTTLAEAIRSYPSLFPRMFVSIVAVGERSGTVDESFSYLTEHYRKEVTEATKRLPRIIEPILLIILALGVAFIAIAIILPIYQFTSQVRN